MNGLIVALLFVASACASPLKVEDVTTAFGYHQKIGMPLAEQIRKSEESNSRIIGGQASELGQDPWQAGLLISLVGTTGQSICGAVLIGASKAVTAAHCWYDGVNQASSVTVILGTVQFFFGGTRISTSQVVTHPRWFPLLIRNDIATITLPTAVALSDVIAPIALPIGDLETETFAGETAVASGFGHTVQGGPITTEQVLSRVEVNIIDNSICRLAYPLQMTDNNICIQAWDGSGTCNGDSGGPLSVTRDGTPVLVGITSFGSGLGCQTFLPKVFARVSSFLDFILEN